MKDKEEKIKQLKEDFSPAFIDGDHIVEELDSGFVQITKSKYDSLRKIKEKSLKQFHKRFGNKQLTGTLRSRTRQLETFLDKRGVKTWAPSSEQMGYFVFIPGQARALWCDVSSSEKKKGYHYSFIEVDKHGNFEGF